MAYGYGQAYLPKEGTINQRRDVLDNPWRAIIDVPSGLEKEIYSKMPALGGYTTHKPGTVYTASGYEREIYYHNGKKHLRPVKKPTDEKKQVSREEALNSFDLMWLYLKQYNKKKDKKWEKEELEMLDDQEEEEAIMGH